MAYAAIPGVHIHVKSNLPSTHSHSEKAFQKSAIFQYFESSSDTGHLRTLPFAGIISSFDGESYAPCTDKNDVLQFASFPEISGNSGKM